MIPDPGKSPATQSGILIPALAFVVTVAVFLPFASRGLDVHHDGLMLKTALDVQAGQTLFKDTFTQYGALTTALHVLALRVLGGSLLSLKYLTVLTYGMAAAFLTAAWGEFLPRRLVALAFGFWLLFAPFYAPGYVLLPWASVIALAFQAACLYCLLRSLRPGDERRRQVWVFVAGANAALVFWSRTPVGIFLAGALLCAYLLQPRDRIRNLVLSLAGMATISLFFAVPILSSHSLAPWIEQTFIWPRRWASVMGGGTNRFVRSILTDAVDGETLPLQGLFRWLTVLGFGLGIYGVVRASKIESAAGRRRIYGWMAGAATLVAILCAAHWETASSIRPWAFWVPIVVLGYFLRKLFTRSLTPVLLACSLVCFASWLQLYPVTDPRHIFWGLSPFFGLMVYAVYQATRQNQKLVGVGFCLLLAPLLVSRLLAAGATLSRPLESVESVSRLRGMKVDAGQALWLKSLFGALDADERSNGKRALVVDGPDALAAALASDLTNFDPFYVEWSQYQRPRAESVKREVFVRATHPWILVQPPRMADITLWVREFGYRELVRFEGEFGVLLAPPSAHPEP